MNRTEMRAAVKLDLASSTISDDLINRGIQRAVNDLSNILPRQRFQQQRIDFTREKNFDGTTSQLQLSLDKFVRPKSETITPSLSRNTDYEIDYLNGILTVYANKLTAGQRYRIEYTVLEIALDISSISDTLVRVRKIEYPAGQIPQLYPDFEVDRDDGLLIIKSREIPTQVSEFQDVVQVQQQLVEDEYIWIHFDIAHEAPGDDSRGTYQPILDETVIKGAEYYVFYADAVKDLNTASSTLDTVLTDLAAITVTDFPGTVPGAHGLSAPVLDIDTALDNLQSDSLFTTMTTLLTRISDQTDHETADRIAKKTLDVLEAIDTTVSGITTRLDSIDYTDYENVLADAMSTSDVEGDLTLAAGAWAEVTKWLEESGGHEKANAEEHLDTGTDLINVLTTGERAAAVRADYARVATEVARIYMQSWNSYIAQAQTRLGLARAYHDENVLKAETARITGDRPNLEIQEANSFIGYMNSFISAVATGMNEGMAVLDRKIALFDRDLRVHMEKLATTDRQIALYNLELARLDREAVAYDRVIEGIDRKIAIANSELTTVDRYLDSGRRRLEQALVLRDEYFAELNNRLSDLRSVPALPA